MFKWKHKWTSECLGHFNLNHLKSFENYLKRRQTKQRLQKHFRVFKHSKWRLVESDIQRYISNYILNVFNTEVIIITTTELAHLLISQHSGLKLHSEISKPLSQTLCLEVVTEIYITIKAYCSLQISIWAF